MEKSSDTLRKQPGRAHQLNGREYLYFGGTSYLGLSVYEPWIELVKEGLDIYGASFGSSRRSNTPLPVFEELEYNLAQWMGSEACLTCSSGTLAGRLVLDYTHRFDKLFYMPDAHPASWDSRSFLQEENHADWKERVLEYGRVKNDDQPLCILIHSVNPLTPELVDLDWIFEIEYNGPVYLFVDDSHGIGVLGKAGQGTISGLKLPINFSLITYGSLAKAMGTQGGFIAADYNILFEIMNIPLFGGSSPMSPASAYALLNGLEIVEAKNQTLKENIGHFREKFFTETYFSSNPKLPVFTSLDADLTKYLYDRGILISDFTYPGPEDPRYIRIVLNALHKLEDLNTLAFYLQQYYEPTKL